MRSAAHDFLFEAIRDRAILNGRNQTLIGPSGSKNEWLFDVRAILTDSSVLQTVATTFWEVYADKLPFQVGGMEVSAIPLVTAILLEGRIRGTPISGFIVRKERKTYGTGNLLEGVITDQPIVVVDDIFNSGRSLEKVRVILQQYSRAIDDVFVLVDYKNPLGMLWRSLKGIRVTSVFDLAEFGLKAEKKQIVDPPNSFVDVWDFKAPDPNFFHCVPKSFPLLDNNKIYFGSDCGIFWCLDAPSGRVVWTFAVEAPGHKNIWSAPAVCGDQIYFGGYDGNVYCLEKDTGKEIWRFIGAEWVGSSPAIANDLGLIFIGLEFSVEGRRGSIVALDLKSGVPIWEYPTNRYTHASPAYSPELGLVACGSNDDEMFLFDARTGELRWRFSTKTEGVKSSIRHAPAFDLSRNQLITGCANGYVYIIDLETGQEVWSVRTGNTIYSIPLVVGDHAYIGSTDKHFYVLDLNAQTVRTKIYVRSKIFCPPRVFDGKVYFGACSGMIFEFDPISMQICGTHQLPDGVTNALAYSEELNLFFALTYVNHLYAFERRQDPFES